MNNETSIPCWSVRIGQLPLQRPLIVKETETLENCILLMQKYNRGCVLVVNDLAALTGIITDRDLMFHFIGTPLPPHDPVSVVMTRQPYTLSPEVDVAQAMDVLGEKPFRHIPVMKDKDILGLLSVRVLIDFIAEHVPDEVLNLPPELGDVPKETFGA